MVASMLALLKPMKDLAFVQTKFYRGIAGAQTVFELLDETVEEDYGTKSLERATGKIKFSNVGFNYADSKEVLNNISFTIEPGEVVALVGRSGSGKSTIISLLSRFYENYSGEISLDNVSIKDYKLKDLRRQFAMVSQHVTLFHDTVANNIAYGRFADVTEAEIVAAAKASHAMEFIEKLPNGMNSLIGENGVLLSGGQRQRIAIARAIIKNAPILILDEATSSLDTESERYIQSALEDLMKSRTTLVVAHRLSTVEHANKIVVMDGGRIIEVGTHESLLASDGHYAKLYRLQFKDAPQVLEAVG
jgi:subfamily B ATP-binding cassette protein MsbA